MPDPSLALADGVPRPLDPRYIPLQRTVGWIVAGVLGSGLTFGVAVMSIALWPRLGPIGAAALGAALVLAGLVWMAQRWPALDYSRASYVLDERGIEIRRGVVWRRVINVPRSRVQHTDVAQGPLERIHGLGTLIIYTAGTDHAQVQLPGLAHETALAIRDHLLPRELADAV